MQLYGWQSQSKSSRGDEEVVACSSTSKKVSAETSVVVGVVGAAGAVVVGAVGEALAVDRVVASMETWWHWCATIPLS